MDEAERLSTRLAVIDHGQLIACDTPRALIEAHVEPEVIEVFGDDARAWADAQGRESRRAGRGRRRDRVLLRAAIRSRCSPRWRSAPGLRYLHRPANLEDLFIKLTGRELRD